MNGMIKFKVEFDLAEAPQNQHERGNRMNGMIKFKVEFDLEVLPQDQDLLLIVPDIIMDRFRGTAIRVSRTTVTNLEPVSIGPDNPELAAAIIKKQEESEETE